MFPRNIFGFFRNDVDVQNPFSLVAFHSFLHGRILEKFDSRRLQDMA